MSALSSAARIASSKFCVAFAKSLIDLLRMFLDEPFILYREPHLHFAAELFPASLYKLAFILRPHFFGQGNSLSILSIFSIRLNTLEFQYTTIMKKLSEKNALIAITIIWLVSFGYLLTHKFQEWSMLPFIESTIGVFMGTAALGFITWIIIQQQSKLEKKKEIFDERISLYKRQIKLFNKILKDDKVDYEEFNKLVLETNNYRLLASNETTAAYTELLGELANEFEQASENEISLSDSQSAKLSQLINAFRKDLDLGENIDANVFSKLSEVTQKSQKVAKAARYTADASLAVKKAAENIVKIKGENLFTVDEVRTELKKKEYLDKNGTSVNDFTAMIKLYIFSKQFLSKNDKNYNRGKKHADANWFDEVVEKKEYRLLK